MRCRLKKKGYAADTPVSCIKNCTRDKPCRMPSCSAIGCSYRGSDRYYKGLNVRLYRIPSPRTPFDEERRELWVQALRRSHWGESGIRNGRVCSQHFITGAYSLDRIHPDFVPSIFSFSKPRDLQKGLERLKRYERTVKRVEEKGVAYVPDTPTYTSEQRAVFNSCTTFNWPSFKSVPHVSEVFSVAARVEEQIHGLKRGDIVPFIVKSADPTPDQDLDFNYDPVEVRLTEVEVHIDHNYSSSGESGYSPRSPPLQRQKHTIIAERKCMAARPEGNRSIPTMNKAENTKLAAAKTMGNPHLAKVMEVQTRVNVKAHFSQQRSSKGQQIKSPPLEKEQIHHMSESILQPTGVRPDHTYCAPSAAWLHLQSPATSAMPTSEPHAALDAPSVEALQAADKQLRAHLAITAAQTVPTGSNT